MGPDTRPDGSAGRLHALRWGESGSPVLFLHGLFGQARNWATIGQALAPEHRVTALDLPHHGRSPWPERLDYLEMAEQVAQMIDPAAPTAVVGHSMGGKVAMALALTRPELVRRLVVVDMSPVTYDRMREFRGYTTAMRELQLDRVDRRRDADEALAAQVPSRTIRSFLLQNLTRDGDGWRWRANLEVLDRDLAVLGGWPTERLADLAPYPGRVLWMAGERSDYVLPEYEPAMNRWFPRNRLVRIKRAGHWLHSEQPDVVIEVLRAFLADPA